MFSVHDFYSQTHAKWILAGEHAVLRGHSALVFPLHAKKMTLQYQDNGSALSADFDGEQGADLHLLFWSVIEHGLKHVNRDLSHVTGHFVLSNTIPIGSGLGASAALCLNIGRWFAWKQWIPADDLFDFSKYLEDLFHGKSSGLDLAGSLYDTGTYFSPKPDYPLIEPIKPTWKPHWYLSFSGQIGITSHCVRKVEQLQQQSPDLALQLDNDMERAVQLARKALETQFDENNSEEGLKLLIQAINQAKQCFSVWELIGSTLENHMNDLLNAGAIACKPTGSGDGGYVLSLWKEPAPLESLKNIQLVSI
jgi:mevalonate kinase